MKCARETCTNTAQHYNKLSKKWYCTDCAKEIQGFENTMPMPIEVFTEFFEVGYLFERV